MPDLPLVSCIMPTHGRREFVARAIDCFLGQDYQDRELIIADDGDDPIADLVPDLPMIRYLRLDQRLALGAKRNFACEAARGSVIAHWDDDDWHAPKRLGYQVRELLAGGADVCGLSSLLFIDPGHSKAWRYTYPPEARPWLAGGTLCYRRSFWDRHPFAQVNAGEDGLFLWDVSPDRVLALADSSFYVATIHAGNSSPKATDGPLWQPITIAELVAAVGDRTFFAGDGVRPTTQETPATLPMAAPAAAVTRTAAPLGPSASAPETDRVRNVFACLVHESPECVVDLVRNLHHFDPTSPILLYNGGPDPRLLDGFPLEDYGVLVVPSPQPMTWGRLHDFALDSMRFALANLTFDSLTIVDSDQLAARGDYSAFIAPAVLGRAAIGLLSNSIETQPPGTTVGPAVAAYQEFELWRPFLRRFPKGETRYPQWCFWPSTVFARDVTKDLTGLFDTDAELRSIMERTQIWASEEVILPTLVALLGYEIAPNPCSYDFVKYREPYSLDQLAGALARDDVYWVHPVPRRYDDPLRSHMRQHANDYRRSNRREQAEAKSVATTARILPTLPVLERMRPIEGWLEDDEADLLLAAAAHALSRNGTHPIVEIGSYCGRSSVVLASAVKALAPASRVYAIDPHEGMVGALDQGLTTGLGTLDRFRRNVATAGVADVIEVIQRHSYDVDWEGPIGLLLLDGLHDYANVSRDFQRFRPFLQPGSLIGFHDYATYYPGVVAFVDELISSGSFGRVALARSMIVLERLGEEAVP